MALSDNDFGNENDFNNFDNDDDGDEFDFGSDERVKAPQPGNKNLVDRSAVAGRKVWRIVAKNSSTQTNTVA